MKKLFYLMAVASLFIALPLTSCSDDDDDEVTAEIPTPKTLNLTGALNVTVGGEEQAAVSQAIVLTDNADGTITLTISNFSFKSFDFGDIVIENCALGEDGSFSGEATVTYDLLSLNIPLTITGTYDGSNVKFSSTFQIAEIDNLEVSFTYDSTVQVTESDDQGSSFVQPEGSTAYTGTLSGSYFMGFMSLDEIETTIYYADGVIALEELEVMGFSLSNIYIYYENADEDGTSFTDGTAEASFLGFPMSFEGVSGSVTFDETGAITLSVGLSIPLDTFGISLSDILDSFDLGSLASILGDKNDIDVTINFTNVYDPFKIVEETETISGTLTAGNDTGVATVTVGVNGDSDTVYSISEFKVGYTTYSSVVIVVDAEGTASAHVKTSTADTDATSVTFTAGENGSFEATIEYKGLITSTTLTLTFTEGTSAAEE